MSKLDKQTAEPAEVKAATPKAEPVKTAPKAPAKMLVLDTTAKDGPRVHEQIVNDSIQSFTFLPGKGLPLDPAIAVKFLKHDGFKRIDDEGNLLEWRRAPRQPDELGAGEAIKLADTETIARVDELSTAALLQRALEMPNGERFTLQSKRSDMVDFIVSTTVERKKKASSKAADVGADEYTPEPEADDMSDAA